MKVGIIGNGRIGQETMKRVLQRGWKVPVIVDIDGVYNSSKEKIAKPSDWLDCFKGMDIAVLSIPTLDDGRIAYEYIKALVEIGIPVVTSEKGALGNYFPELKPLIDKNKIGYSATVGGGTRLLHWLRERLSPGVKEIHLIINGTLNYIFDELSKGRALDVIIEETKRLGYAEPLAQEPLEVINTEACRDIPMKISVLLNICGFGEIRARDINVQPLTEVDLKKLIKEAASRRFIVSIVKEEEVEDRVGGFELKCDKWYVSGGFKNRNRNPLFSQLIPPGVNNAALVYGVAGTYILTGPGAGATPTVMGSIIKDIEDLLKSH